MKKGATIKEESFQPSLGLGSLLEGDDELTAAFAAAAAVDSVAK